LLHCRFLSEGHVLRVCAKQWPDRRRIWNNYAAVAPHNPLGPISLAAGLQLAASVPNFLCQEQVTLGEGYLKEPFQVEHGYVRIPEGPGLGIELDEHQIANKLDHDWRNRETYDLNDGSVVDW